MATLDNILQSVQEEATLEDSVITLLQNIKDNGADPAKMQAVIDQLTANKDKLKAVLVANTPAANVP